MAVSDRAAISVMVACSYPRLVLPSFRWIVERVGSRRLYVSCLLGFTLTSALCACAWSAESLIAFRILQGAVGGLLTPLAQALAAQLAGPKRMGRAVGLISVPVLVAPLLGPTLGGLVIQWLSWRWVFLINAPVGLLGAWLAQRYLPMGNTTNRTRLDMIGLALLSPGIGLFTYAVSLAGHERSFSSTGLGTGDGHHAAVVRVGRVGDARRVVERVCAYVRGERGGQRVGGARGRRPRAERIPATAGAVAKEST